MEAIPQMVTLTYVNLTKKVSTSYKGLPLAHSSGDVVHLAGEVWKLRQLHSEWQEHATVAPHSLRNIKRDRPKSGWAITFKIHSQQLISARLVTHP